MSYQKHIDGLRAIAIIWVVAFHYFPTVFSGGFIGVDVFFVISGYLISGIIWSELGAGEFSFARFYVRRVRRIFPALVLVLSSSVFLGYHLLHDTEYRQLAKHVLASALFLNNWVLSVEKGYFDVASEFKPLLHLWSLSIEEQFYLVWPLLLVGIHRQPWAKSKTKWLIVGLMGCSFVACCYQTFSQPISAFYSPFFRVWELMAGAALHLLSESWRERMRRVSFMAWPALLIGLFFIQPHHPFPGLLALVPVLCAVLLLNSRATQLEARVLCFKPLVLVGKISYPLYLWHWPLLVFAHLYMGFDQSSLVKCIIIFLAFLISALTKLLLEDPFRFGAGSKIKAWILLAIMATLACLAVYIYQTNGLPRRDFNQRNLPLGSGDLPPIKHLYQNQCAFNTTAAECLLDKAAQHPFVVLGDSKGKALFTGLMQVTQGRDGWIFLGSDPGLKPSSSSAQHDPMRSYTSVIDMLNHSGHVQRIVLAVALRSLFHLKTDDSVLDLAHQTEFQQSQVGESVYRALKQLNQPGRQLWVLLDHPTFLHPPKCATRQQAWAALDVFRGSMPQGCSMSLQEHLGRTQIYFSMWQHVQQRLAKEGVTVELFDPTPLLCDTIAGRCEMTANGRYLYDFTDHFSSYAGRMVAQELLLRQEK